MNKYIGTKTVKAEPMSMGDAYESKLLKEGKRPSECETDKAGYLVESEDGYQSWSPANVFEKAYDIAETPLDRMRIECKELVRRYQKGAEYITSQKYSNLNYLARVLLSAQHDTQREYKYLLVDRIKNMTETKPLLEEFDFGTAIKFLTAGGAIRRASWAKMGAFVVKQIPALITEDIIPNMQSLPQIAKDILMKREEPHIDYVNQMLVIYPDGRADSWVPALCDIFARDWQLVY